MKKIFLSIVLLFALQYVFSQASVSYYKGEWTTVNKHDLFTGLFKIDISAEGKATIEIVWTYLATDSTNKNLPEMYKGKKGRSGIEYAEGIFSATTNDFTFEGKSADDPALILGLDKYHLKLAANKQAIYGTSETQGTNEGLLYATKLASATGKKEFMAAKARIKK
jgi:hypothetical protein